jgi:hypothetical protein
MNSMLTTLPRKHATSKHKCRNSQRRKHKIEPRICATKELKSVTDEDETGNSYERGEHIPHDPDNSRTLAELSDERSRCVEARMGKR